MGFGLPLALRKRVPPDDKNPYELYHNNHEEHPEKKLIVDICIPVRHL